MENPGSVSGGGWLQALGLMGITGALSVLNPGVLVAVPFAFLVLARPEKGWVPTAISVLALILVFGGEPTSGIWYLERGWALLLAGWFLAVTLRWPREPFLPRSLGALAGSVLAVALLFWVRPGDWLVVDWMVTSRMEEGMSAALEAARITMGSGAVPGAFEERILEAMSVQTRIFPALLCLGSLSGLGLAWWIFQRMTRNGDESLKPLREFRFNDQLIWVLIVGLLVLLGTSGLAARLGTNAVVFMGALYALRGIAVVLFLSGGISFLSGFLFVLAMVFVAPLIIGGAFIIGLGDTWLDLRTRRGEPPPA